MTGRIDLDFNATTPPAPEMVAAMLPFLDEVFGNPSSRHWQACLLVMPWNVGGALVQKSFSLDLNTTG